MKKIILITLCLFITAPTYAANEDLKHWAGLYFSLRDYKSKGNALTRLGLEEGSEKYKEIKQAVDKAFHQYIKRELPFRDVSKQFMDLRFKYVEDKRKTFPKSDYSDFYDEAEAYMIASLKAEYGPGAGVYGCHISIKGSEFPVLYEIRIVFGDNGDLRAYALTSDIGYSTPDGIHKELIRVVEEIIQHSAKYVYFEY